MKVVNPFVDDTDSVACGGVDRRMALVPETRTLGRYRLRFRFARGGMASVYLAQLTGGDQSFRKWVAIKTMHPHLVDDQRFVQMFLSEAKLGARINHPNVCNVFDVGEAEGTYYMAMEYLHGESLSAVLQHAGQKEGMPTGIAARIIADAARGLHACHELCAEDGRNAGVVHRDVSPQNIFVLYEGVAKIVDFGVARVSGSELTVAGEVKGKLAYMAPEQLRSEEIDRRADVFALGVVLWEATVGRKLFGESGKGDDASVVAAIISSKITPPSELVPGYPEELGRIVMRALAYKREDRFQTAGELGRALEVFLARTDDVVSPTEVSELMHTLFGERIATRNALLRRQPVSVLPGPMLDYATVERDIESADERFKPKKATNSLARNRVTTAAAMVGTLAVAVSMTWWLKSDTRNPAAPTWSPVTMAPVPQSVRIQSPVSEVAVEGAGHGTQTTETQVLPSARAPGRHARPAPVPQHIVRPEGMANASAHEIPAVASPSTPVTPVTSVGSGIRDPRAGSSAPLPARAAVIAAPPPVTPTPALAPASVAPALGTIQSVQGTLAGLRGNGISVMPLRNRAAAVASVMGQCATRESRTRGATSSFGEQVHTTLVLEVRDRRLDTVRLRGGPNWLGACVPAVRGAFLGSLPEGSDAEYSIEIDVGLTGQR